MRKVIIMTSAQMNKATLQKKLFKIANKVKTLVA